ncbi:MAG: ATP-dependent metallopeptidase FtsH/Yme1/Tma family protein, partial [Hominenteromicrobium sp.]
MNEVKTPKKPLIFYYGIVLLILLLFNALAVPAIMQRQVEEVDYGTFMTMTEEKDIGRVEVEDNQIVFTNKDDSKIFKTGVMNDPDLVTRLHDSGAQFASEIVEEMSPLMSFLLTWILPMLVFIGLGQLLTRRMMSKMGGGSNSMMFNMGKSNAKV